MAGKGLDVLDARRPAGDRSSQSSWPGRSARPASKQEALVDDLLEEPIGEAVLEMPGWSRRPRLSTASTSSRKSLSRSCSIAA